MFSIYLELGFQHIQDWQGYDHILFIIALCAIYKIEQWKNLLILVTAFTIGHSLTLALAALDIIKVKMDVVEFLIPLTIFITALFNVFRKETTERITWNYSLALLVGLIHGLGFSNYFSMLVEEEELLLTLFAFNVGLELGQLLIVAVILVVSYLVLNILKASQREWTVFISGATAGIAFIMMIERWIF